MFSEFHLLRGFLRDCIVILLSDKADEAIFTFFYEMLEDGQYTDLDGKVVDLDGYIIVFTANLNSDNFKNMIPLHYFIS